MKGIAGKHISWARFPFKRLSHTAIVFSALLYFSFLQFCSWFLVTFNALIHWQVWGGVKCRKWITIITIITTHVKTGFLFLPLNLSHVRCLKVGRHIQEKLVVCTSLRLAVKEEFQIRHRNSNSNGGFCGPSGRNVSFKSKLSELSWIFFGLESFWYFRFIVTTPTRN